MAVQETYIATVQVVINPNNSGVDSEAGACDWFSGLLSDNEQVLDWTYLKIGGQHMSPKDILVDPDNYEEGAAFT